MHLLIVISISLELPYLENEIYWKHLNQKIVKLHKNCHHDNAPDFTKIVTKIMLLKSPKIELLWVPLCPITYMVEELWLWALDIMGLKWCHYKHLEDYNEKPTSKQSHPPSLIWCKLLLDLYDTCPSCTCS
jgi:hypothetical protein